MEVVKDVYSYAPWRTMPQCSDEWGPDVLQSEPEGQYYSTFCVSGFWYFVWEEISPSIFLHYLPFFFLLSYDPTYDEDLILGSRSLCES